MATLDYLITSRCVNFVAQISTDFGRWLALLESDSHDLADFKFQQMPVKVHASIGFEEQPQQLERIRLEEAYNQLLKWNFHSSDDLKNAHQLICAAVTPSAGSYRATGMGVYRNNKLVHMTAPAGQAGKSVNTLLSWLQQSHEHPLPTYFGISTRNKVLRLLNEQPDWSAARVAVVLNISSRAVEKHISKLKQQKLLIRKGSARGGYWRVTNGIEEQLSLPADWS